MCHQKRRAAECAGLDDGWQSQHVVRMLVGDPHCTQGIHLHAQRKIQAGLCMHAYKKLSHTHPC